MLDMNATILSQLVLAQEILAKLVAQPKCCSTGKRSSHRRCQALKFGHVGCFLYKVCVLRTGLQSSFDAVNWEQSEVNAGASYTSC